MAIVKELDISIDPVDSGHVEMREHSQQSGAKAVVVGATHFVKDNSLPETKAPISTAISGASASATMEFGKVYRLVSDVGFYFKMSLGANTATTSDIYQPADMPLVIHTQGNYNTISYITGGAGGTAQLQEIL